MSREYTDTGIRINRSMRRWHRYGKQILAICIAAAAVIAIIAIAAGIGGSGSSGSTQNGSAGSPNEGGEAVAVSESSSEEESKAESTESKEDTDETDASEETDESETTKESGGNGKGGTIDGKAVVEDFNSEDFYEDAAFIGDIFVYGIDEYEFLDSSKLFSATFMNAKKALALTEDVADTDPKKVFVMLGFDDENLSEDRTAEESADAILELLEDLKDKLPSADIYAVSEAPISEEYNDNGGDYVSQEDLDEINNLVKSGAKSLGVGYIDVAASLKDGEYLSEEYSTDGCHITKAYYPFILNGIAEAAK